MEIKDKLDRDKDLYTIAVMRYKDEFPEIDVYNSFTDEWNISKNEDFTNNYCEAYLRELKSYIYYIKL